MNADAPHAVEDAEAASAAYSVEVTTENIDAVRAWWRSALLAVFTVFWLNASESPKLVTTVAVVRKADGAIVESYEYRDPIAASPHVQLLHGRLVTLSKSEFEDALCLRH